MLVGLFCSNSRSLLKAWVFEWLRYSVSRRGGLVENLASFSQNFVQNPKNATLGGGGSKSQI